MAENEIVVNLQLDLSEIENRLSSMDANSKGLGNLINTLQKTVAQSFLNCGRELTQIRSVVTSGGNAVIESIKSFAAVEVTSMSEIKAGLDGINNAIQKVVENQQNGKITENASNFFSALNNIDQFYKRNAKPANKANPNGGPLLGLPAAGETTRSGAGGDSASGMVSSLFAGAGELYAYDNSMDDLIVGIGDVALKLEESALAWGTELKAKMASKAEDIAIIALYAADYAKQFGMMIANLVTSAGLWIKDTAIKVANTAAQWANVAATTAWQAICAAATAVTTAFGTAMAFLTSPIGLVVIGITALIAIIVLLIANWDTVKAAVLSAWEAIKGALATAADWFNTNVLQPLVGFFQDAMAWIGEKVQAGIAFVQAIFAGIGAFLQGAFAKDWTEQFGAFGNVLNAFFHNVENVWNAVKSIFSGIVSFVKNVFAGNWSGAWNSIVEVFRGIWDYLVAVVKAPLNAIIGFINGLMAGVVSGINVVIKALNRLNFQIPDWDIFGSLAGKSIGFSLTPLTAPKIPYLAKGAVLPANKPFLAVVGDQRHGTNIEAPLATIQEAVALVMEDHIAAMMAGFQALLEEQRATRQTIEEIDLGDSVIGQAAERYMHKMAVVRGGYF